MQHKMAFVFRHCAALVMCRINQFGERCVAADRQPRHHRGAPGASCSLVGARYPVAVESGGHSMWQLDACDVLQGLRVQDRQLAAVGGPVIHITHQHTVVLGRIGR